jgi:hypothetical protein
MLVEGNWASDRLVAAFELSEARSEPYVSVLWSVSLSASSSQYPTIPYDMTIACGGRQRLYRAETVLLAMRCLTTSVDSLLPRSLGQRRLDHTQYIALSGVSRAKRAGIARVARVVGFPHNPRSKARRRPPTAIVTNIVFASTLYKTYCCTSNSIQTCSSSS